MDLKSNEYAFDIKSDSTVNAASVSSTVVYGDGQAFAPGSKTQKNPYWIFQECSGVPGIAASTISGGCYSRANTIETDITIQGATQKFQSVQDAGGGQLQINTTNTTGFANGDIVWLPNSIYAGKYTISNLVVNTSFEITADYDVDILKEEEYHIGWTKIVGNSIEVNHSERSFQSANNEITFTNLALSLVKCVFNYTIEGDATADTVEVCIMKNDDIIGESIKSRIIRTSPAEGFCDGSDEVVATDTLTAYVRNMSHDTRNVLFSHFHLSTNK